MHLVRWLGLAALVSLTAPAHAAEPRAVIPAMHVVQAGHSFIMWAPDLRSVLGHDANGDRRWRLATGDQGGHRDLQILGDNVLVMSGADLTLLAPDTGKVLGVRRGVLVDTAGGCNVEHHEGACALSCPCSFEVIACENLARLGDPFPLAPQPDAPGTCAPFSADVLGRSGDTVITMIPGSIKTAVPTSPVSPSAAVPTSPAVVGRDAKTGAERWRSRVLAFFDPDLSGVSATPNVCYAGGRGKVIGFDCASGAVVWQRPLGKGNTPQVDAHPAGLLVREDSTLALVDPRTGVAHWQAALPDSSIAFMAGLRAAPARRIANDIRGARIFGVDGKRLGDITFPKATTRWPRPFNNGWLVIADKQIIAFDANGKSLGGIGSSDSYIDAAMGDTTRIAAWNKAGATVDQLPHGGPSLDLDGRGAIVGLERGLGPNRVGVFIAGKTPWDPTSPDTFGELRIYILSP